MSTGEPETPVRLVQLWLCDLCLDGAGGECHTPGCALWINRAPDLPLRDSVFVTVLDGQGGAFFAASPEQMLREFHASKAVHGGLMPPAPTAGIPGWVRDLRTALLDEEVGELREAVAAGDIVKIADALADIEFITRGTAVVYGIPSDAVFAEIFRSNMTKVNTPEEAKLVKGPDYEPPRITEILARTRSQCDGALAAAVGAPARGEGVPGGHVACDTAIGGLQADRDGLRALVADIFSHLEIAGIELDEEICGEFRQQAAHLGVPGSCKCPAGTCGCGHAAAQDGEQ